MQAEGKVPGDRQIRRQVNEVMNTMYSLGRGSPAAVATLAEQVRRTMQRDVLTSGGDTGERAKVAAKIVNQVENEVRSHKPGAAGVMILGGGGSGGTMTTGGAQRTGFLAQMASNAGVSARAMNRVTGLGRGVFSKANTVDDPSVWVARKKRGDHILREAIWDLWHENDERITRLDSWANSRNKVCTYRMKWTDKDGKPLYQKCARHIQVCCTEEALRVYREWRKPFQEARVAEGYGPGYSDRLFLECKCPCVKMPAMTSCACEVCAKPALALKGYNDAKSARRRAGKTVSLTDDTCKDDSCKACNTSRENAKVHKERVAMRDDGDGDGGAGAEGGAEGEESHHDRLVSFLVSQLRHVDLVDLQ